MLLTQFYIGKPSPCNQFDVTLTILQAQSEYGDKLKVKDDDKYTPEQFQAWAHIIQMKNYESYENPPDK